MTSQQLYEILKFLDALDKKLGLQAKLESIRSSLSNLASQPAQPQHQTALASALSEFDSAVSQLAGLITPSQYSLIEAMGGGDFFDLSMAEKVRNAVEKNAMTPSVARDLVTDLAARRADFLSTVSNAWQNLDKLKITTSPVAPGSADLAFLIPRDIFDNELSLFAKELNFISRLLQDFGEGLTGEVQQVQLEQLSSSVPTVALVASVPVIGAVAFAVNKFLEAWERIEKIRKLRAELSDIGMKKMALDELDEQITTTVDEVVEEATATVLVNYNGKPERKNELTNAIRTDTRRLFGQIELGLTVEFRAQPKKDGNPDEQKALQEINNLSRTMHFPEVVPEPMLLQSGELLEGDIQTLKHSKKTTTHKTTKRVFLKDSVEKKEQ